MLYLKMKNRNPFENFNSIKKGVLSSSNDGEKTKDALQGQPQSAETAQNTV